MRLARLPTRFALGAALGLAVTSPAHAEPEPPPSARAGGAGGAEGATDDRWNALLSGEIIKEPQRIEAGNRQLVGGISYALVGVGLSDVAALVDDVKSYASFLPFTKKARLVGENDGDRFVEMTSGNSMMSVQYTLRVRRTEPGMLRFWMDPSRPHDVPDAWGFLRWQPVDTPAGPRLLLTCGILAELPDDLTGKLFGDRVQRALLSVLPRVAGALQDFRVARTRGANHSPWGREPGERRDR